ARGPVVGISRLGDQRGDCIDGVLLAGHLEIDLRRGLRVALDECKCVVEGANRRPDEFWIHIVKRLRREEDAVRKRRAQNVLGSQDRMNARGLQLPVKVGRQAEMTVDLASRMSSAAIASGCERVMVKASNLA